MCFILSIERDKRLVPLNRGNQWHSLGIQANKRKIFLDASEIRCTLIATQNWPYRINGRMLVSATIQKCLDGPLLIRESCCPSMYRTHARPCTQDTTKSLKGLSAAPRNPLETKLPQFSSPVLPPSLKNYRSRQVQYTAGPRILSIPLGILNHSSLYVTMLHRNDARKCVRKFDVRPLL